MTADAWRKPWVLLSCCAAILFIGIGIRHGFGLFLQPMSMDNGWDRGTFAFAFGLQNLVWGLATPLSGIVTDKFGAGRAIVGGAMFYIIGLVGMAYASTGFELALSAGICIGLALSGTGFSVVLAAVSRAVPPQQRSMAMGIASAVGSFGQFAMLPGALGLISWLGWSAALLALAALSALVIPLAAPMFGRPANESGPTLTVREALAEAAGHRGYWLLCMGYFVCGFQIIFISLHIPAYLSDRGMSIGVGTTVLALIGLANVAGSYIAGILGGKYSKPRLLAGLYGLRGIFIALFMLVPLSEYSAYAFGLAMGFLWLSTVPLTTGTVATVFGMRNMSMLSGIAFLFHQIGGFLGGWLGGALYDATGSYDIVWMIAIGLSVWAFAMNMPIKEVPVARLRTAA